MSGWNAYVPHAMGFMGLCDRGEDTYQVAMEVCINELREVFKHKRGAYFAITFDDKSLRGGALDEYNEWQHLRDGVDPFLPSKLEYSEPTLFTWDEWKGMIDGFVKDNGLSIPLQLLHMPYTKHSPLSHTTRSGH